MHPKQQPNNTQNNTILPQKQHQFSLHDSTILHSKTAPFSHQNCTTLPSKQHPKMTPLYLQNNTETTMKKPQKQCKKRPVDATVDVDGGRHLRATSVDGVHRRCLPPPPPPSPTMPPLSRNWTCICLSQRHMCFPNPRWFSG